MTDSADILYFDGACPLCSREMNWLRKLKTERLQLVDIHSIADSNAGLPAKELLLEVLHLKKANGEWRRGVDANVEAWSHTRIGIFWKLLKLPGIRYVADQVYYRWARKRYARMYCRVNP